MTDGKNSKFDFSEFFDGYDDFAVNSGKYTVKEALDLYRQEMSGIAGGFKPGDKIAVTEAWVRHRAGVNDDGEPVVGWWLEYEEYPRSCPVYAMHLVVDGKRIFEDKYKTFEVSA